MNNFELYFATWEKKLKTVKEGIRNSLSLPSILAVVCVRNERVHLRRCLTDLLAQGLDVHLIDHGSTDGTVEIAQEFLGQGLLHIDHLPWRGVFSLSEQLQAKQAVVRQATHDWIVHADADEWLCPTPEFATLREGVGAADRAGYTVINFHELVFVPLPGKDFYAEDYAARMRHYYFFQPSYPRLQRAWKRTAHLDNTHSGGHSLAGGGAKLFSMDFFLRHYIVLSEAHAQQKYGSRRFSEEDIRKGWHGNRRRIQAERLVVRPDSAMRELAHPSDQVFDLSQPTKLHFWEWE